MKEDFQRADMYGVYACMFLCILFAIRNKKTCTSLLESPNDNNNYAYDVRYSNAYIKLQYQ